MRKVILFVLLFSLHAHAGVLLEVGGTYLSGTLDSSSVKSSTSYFYNLGVLFSVQKKLWAGWNFSGISQQDKNEETLKFSSIDTGPYIKWQFGKNDVFSLSAAYNIQSKAQYSNDDASEKWSGSSIWLQAGVLPEFKEGLHIGFSINYYLATYSRKTIANVESSAANKKSWLFPMLHLTKQW